jgi:hypothetical protein
MTQHATRARFGVRHASFVGFDHESDEGFGVWDSATNGWHGPSNLTREEAQQRATAIEADYRTAIAERAARGTERRADHHTRPVNPPIDVELQLAEDAPWIPGRLRAWHREPDCWHGEVTVGDSGKPIWIKQHLLREPTATATPAQPTIPPPAKPATGRPAQHGALAASDGS